MAWASILSAIPSLLQGFSGQGQGDQEQGFRPMGLPDQGQQGPNPQALMILQKLFEDIERKRMENNPIFRLKMLLEQQNNWGVPR